MAKIVISYRRNDTKWITGRLFENLERYFGDGNVFMDIDNIPLGLDYREHIRSVLEHCDVLVAVVGPNWQKANSPGETTLDDETDWVRLEISTALARKVPVVPLLIDGTKMPKPNLLPEDLRAFAFRQAANFDTEDFKNQMRRLTSKLDEAIGLQQTGKIQKPADDLVAPLTTAEIRVASANAPAPKTIPEKGSDKSASDHVPALLRDITEDHAKSVRRQASLEVRDKERAQEDQLPTSLTSLVNDQSPPAIPGNDSDAKSSDVQTQKFFEKGIWRIWFLGLVVMIFVPLIWGDRFGNGMNYLMVVAFLAWPLLGLILVMIEKSNKGGQTK